MAPEPTSSPAARADRDREDSLPPGRGDVGRACSYFLQAAELARRGRRDRAVALLEAAIRIEPRPAYLELLAQVLIDQERFALALETAATGVAIDPRNPGCLCLTSICHARLGQHDKADAASIALIQARPRDPISHAGRGWVNLLALDVPGAIVAFREAVRRDPSLEWARAGYLQALKARGVSYRSFLRLVLWLLALPGGVRRLLWILPLIILLALALASRFIPRPAPAAGLAILGLMLHAFTMRQAEPVWNGLRWLHRQGRRSLSPGEKGQIVLEWASLLAILFLAPVIHWKLPAALSLLVLPSLSLIFGSLGDHRSALPTRWVVGFAFAMTLSGLAALFIGALEDRRLAGVFLLALVSLSVWMAWRVLSWRLLQKAWREVSPGSLDSRRAMGDNAPHGQPREGDRPLHGRRGRRRAGVGPAPSARPAIGVALGR